jgi:hypothetical protein
MKRLLDVQPDGLVEVFHYDEATGRIAIEHLQNVTKLIAANKRAAAEGDGYSPSRDLREIAEIPAIILLKWMHEDGINYLDRNHFRGILRKLRDPDWAYLRTSPGRI